MEKVYTYGLYKEAGSPVDLVIPDGYTEIGREAFDSCESLQSIIIPESVTEIGDYAFADCRSITTVNLPKGLTWGKVKSKFEDSPWSKYRPLSAKEEAAKDKLIAGLEPLLSSWEHEFTMDLENRMLEIMVDFSNQHTIVGRYQLKEKFDLQGFIGLCHSEADISDGIPTLRITSWGETIEDFDFSLYKFSNLVLPDGLVIIHCKAFCDCSSLQSVTIPESVTEICKSAFKGCSSLVTVTILNPEIKIDETAFAGCKAITTVNLPKGLTWSKVKTKFEDSPWGKTNPKADETKD